MIMVGFLLSYFLVYFGIFGTLGFLYRRSKLMPSQSSPAKGFVLENRIVISFFLILPLIVLTFVEVMFPGLKITLEVVQQGHLDFVILALLPPILCFSLGYHYFKRIVRT